MVMMRVAASEIDMISVIWMYVFFFFSSRRRHTRCSRDWSSDVCSSDLRRARVRVSEGERQRVGRERNPVAQVRRALDDRSEEHTSELQSRLHLVCRLLLEKKKKKLCSRRDITEHPTLCTTQYAEIARIL